MEKPYNLNIDIFINYPSTQLFTKLTACHKHYGSPYVYAKMPTKHHQHSLPTLLIHTQLIYFHFGSNSVQTQIIHFGPHLVLGKPEREVVQKRQFISTCAHPPVRSALSNGGTTYKWWAQVIFWLFAPEFVGGAKRLLAFYF